MRIIILGGGFAGLAAKASHRDAILIDESDYLIFTPNLVDVVIKGEAETAMIRRKVDLKTKVLGVNFRERRVLTEDGNVSYDKLVIALGYENDTTKVPGAEKYAFTLKSVEDAMRIREQLKSARKVAIIGGGDLGVELAGALVELSSRLKLKEVTVINHGKRLLPHLSENVSLQVEAILRKRVKLLLGTAVKEIKKGSVVTEEETIESDHIFFAGGFRGPKVLEGMELAKKDQRVLVNPDLSSVDYEDVYAVGACAYGIPSDGQTAIQSANHAMRNILLGAKDKFVPRRIADVVKVDEDYLGEIAKLQVRGLAGRLIRDLAYVNVLRMTALVNRISLPGEIKNGS